MFCFECSLSFKENVYNVGFFIEMLSVTLTASLKFLCPRSCAYSSSSQALTDASDQTLPICLEKAFHSKASYVYSRGHKSFSKMSYTELYRQSKSKRNLDCGKLSLEEVTSEISA